MPATHSLYQKTIIEHNQAPKNQKTLKGATHTSSGYNPLCGDHIDLYCTVDERHILQDIAFQADCCAVATASASILSEHFIGKSVEDFEQGYNEFKKLINQEKSCEDNHLDKLNVFKGIWKYPARSKCALLAFETLNCALKNKKSATTET